MKREICRYCAGVYIAGSTHTCNQEHLHRIIDELRDLDVLRPTSKRRSKIQNDTQAERVSKKLQQLREVTGNRWM